MDRILVSLKKSSYQTPVENWKKNQQLFEQEKKDKNNLIYSLESKILTAISGSTTIKEAVCLNPVRGEVPCGYTLKYGIADVKKFGYILKLENEISLLVKNFGFRSGDLIRTSIDLSSQVEINPVYFNKFDLEDIFNELNKNEIKIFEKKISQNEFDPSTLKISYKNPSVIIRRNLNDIEIPKKIEILDSKGKIIGDYINKF